MTWHAAGTYRSPTVAVAAGRARSGSRRSTAGPTTPNLDKARRLLWPIKQKYGTKLSWADLIVFAGNVAMESMGFDDVRLRLRASRHLGTRGDLLGIPRTAWLGDERYSGDRDLAHPLGAVQMGLIYVNPEGPERQPRSPRGRARHPRDLRPHGDERRGDRRADRRRPHLRQVPRRQQRRRRRPRARGMPGARAGSRLAQHAHGTGTGSDTVTSGLEGAWTNDPKQWDNGFLDNLYGYEWELTTSPAGAKQWTPTNPEAQDTVPDAHDPSQRHAPMMLTTDLALRFDPVYGPITKRFHEHPEELADAFAKAWYKLLHRDMGPLTRYLGPWVPAPQLWQDPVPAVDHELVDDADVASLKATILDSGLSVSQLVSTAWASAASFRGTDKRGGAQRRAHPARAAEGLGGQRTGCARHRAAGARARSSRTSTHRSPAPSGCRSPTSSCWAASPRSSGRRRAPATTSRCRSHRGAPTRRRTRPTWSRSRCSSRRADGFRNSFPDGEKLSPETLLLERANLLTLTAPEMTVLVGGMRVLGANCGGSAHGVFTDRPGSLTNDFFVNLLDRCDGVDTRGIDRGGVRGTRPLDRRHEVDRDRGGSRVRFALAAAGVGRGLRRRRRRGEVRPRLRGRVGQGHEPRPLRSRLTASDWLALTEDGSPRA